MRVYVSLDNFIMVEGADSMTEKEIIHNASEQIIAQLQIDEDAFVWVIDTEMDEEQ